MRKLCRCGVKYSYAGMARRGVFAQCQRYWVAAPVLRAGESANQCNCHRVASLGRTCQSPVSQRSGCWGIVSVNVRGVGGLRFTQYGSCYASPLGVSSGTLSRIHRVKFVEPLKVKYTLSHLSALSVSSA